MGPRWQKHCPRMSSFGLAPHPPSFSFLVLWRRHLFPAHCSPLAHSSCWICPWEPRKERPLSAPLCTLVWRACKAAASGREEEWHRVRGSSTHRGLPQHLSLTHGFLVLGTDRGSQRSQTTALGSWALDVLVLLSQKPVGWLVHFSPPSRVPGWASFFHLQGLPHPKVTGTVCPVWIYCQHSSLLSPAALLRGYSCLSPG